MRPLRKKKTVSQKRMNYRVRTLLRPAPLAAEVDIVRRMSTDFAVADSWIEEPSLRLRRLAAKQQTLRPQPQRPSGRFCAGRTRNKKSYSILLWGVYTLIRCRLSPTQSLNVAFRRALRTCWSVHGALRWPKPRWRPSESKLC